MTAHQFVKTFLTICFFIYICDSNTDVQKVAEDNLQEKYGKIIHASVIFRHGERTPFLSYPNDQYGKSFWPDGLGQLLKEGKQRLLNLGKWFRQRYSVLLKTTNTHTNIRMDSSDTDRTIMSAQCFLAGFYPPEESNFLEKELRWQPLPVHTIPAEYDNIISMNKKCPLYEYYIKKMLRKPQITRIFDRYKAELLHMGNHTGLDLMKNVTYSTLFRIAGIYDALTIQRQLNLTLPSWTATIYPEPLRSILDGIMEEQFSEFKVKQLQAGPFLKSITSDMKRKIKNNSTQILHFFSAHDTTIRAIMIALDIYEGVLPPYGAALMFELREKNNENIVTISYENSTSTLPYFLEQPTCETPCSLNKFLQIAGNLTLNDWEQECKRKL